MNTAALQRSANVSVNDTQDGLMFSLRWSEEKFFAAPPFYKHDVPTGELG